MSHANRFYLDQEAIETIADLMDGDAEMIADLIDTHLEAMPELMTSLAAGLGVEDAFGIKEAAHAMKSSNAQLGALTFSNLCLEMETMAKTGALSGASALFDRMKSEFLKVEAALTDWKNHLPRE